MAHTQLPAVQVQVQGLKLGNTHRPHSPIGRLNLGGFQTGSLPAPYHQQTP